MLTVKLFDEEHEDDLEEAINDFLHSLDSKAEIKDIQFRVAVAEDSEGDQVFCFSAMIVYQSNSRVTRVGGRRQVSKSNFF